MNAVVETLNKPEVFYFHVTSITRVTVTVTVVIIKLGPQLKYYSKQ